MPKVTRPPQAGMSKMWDSNPLSTLPLLYLMKENSSSNNNTITWFKL